MVFAENVKTKEQLIGSMLMVGFYGTTARSDSQICQDIHRYHLAGVILFDFNPVDRSKPKNIANKSQLKKLTRELQSCSPDGKLLIAVDQEGGRVQRLKKKYGFYGKFPQATQISKIGEREARKYYNKMAKELASTGINYDLAPVVDLDINPKNHVIHALGRSFGSNPNEVSKYASIFVESMHKKGVITSLKHFPGHGSSMGDTHKGFVDVTAQWKNVELNPYKILVAQKRVDTVMVAHVFNKNIDALYPATLSSKTVNGLLRKKIGFNGVVITDDLQMGAISKKYGLSKTLELAINAGDDILLFGNQLDPKKRVTTKRIVDTVLRLVKAGKVHLKSIKNANIRISNLKRSL